MAQTLTAPSISSTLDMGEHYVSGLNLIAVYIDNVDVTSFILWEGTEITDSLGNIKGMSMRAQEGAGCQKDQELKFLDKRTSKLIFGGYIKEVMKKFKKKDYFEYNLLVQDYTKLVDIITGITENFPAETEGICIILMVIFDQALLKWSWSYIIAGETIDFQVSNVSLRQAFDEVASLGQIADPGDIQRVWYVDYNKYVHYFKVGDELAPFEMSDDSDESTTFKYFDLELTEDVVLDETRGSLTMWKEGLFAGMTLKITNAKLSWVSEPFLIYEVAAKLIAGDMFTNPIFEYTVAFGSYPRRITDRIPPPEEPIGGGGGMETLTPATGSATGNWNSGTATSGLSGADILTISPGPMKVQSLWVSIANFTDGAYIQFRMYHNVNGTERLAYKQTFNKGTDPDGLWLINGSLVINQSLRIEAFSDKSADNGKVMDWENVTT